MGRLVAVFFFFFFFFFIIVFYNVSVKSLSLSDNLPCALQIGRFKLKIKKDEWLSCPISMLVLIKINQCRKDFP